jgi:hypothetical protein
MIFAEIVSDRIEVSFTELPGMGYATSVCALICDAASEPYRRGDSNRWFAGTHRPALAELNGRPC